MQEEEMPISWVQGLILSFNLKLFKLKFGNAFDAGCIVEIDKMQLIIKAFIIVNNVAVRWINGIKIGIQIKYFPFIAYCIPV